MPCHTNHPISQLPWAPLKKGRVSAPGLSSCVGSREAWHVALPKSYLVKNFGILFVMNALHLVF